MLSDNAKFVLEKRYLARDENGNPTETIDGLFHRVAHAIAKADKKYGGDPQETENEFYEMMTELEFLPNSPTLMNAGRENGQLSACFVLPVEDSIDSIFDAIKQAAIIHKSGGGTGFSFAKIRPDGSTVASTGGVASGPVSFMKVFDSATEAIKQGGKRRGANMGILDCRHPDILSFITCKEDNNEINNFNISIGIDDGFMNAVDLGDDYELIDPKTKMVVGKLNAREVFNKIVESAWKNGEPGIVFLDRVNEDNIVPKQGRLDATNPCGEQPLLPFESCNLGSINLTKMVIKTEDGYELDKEKLKRTVRKAVHFLDNVIDENVYPLKRIDTQTKKTRKIGLGVMGWADLLLMLKIPYNSEKAISLAEDIMKLINDTGHNESAELAKTRGTFPLFKESTLEREERNGTVTTVAPTGTISIIGGCSSGIEPIFAYVFIRNVMDGTQMIEVNPILREEFEKRGIYSDELMKRISKEGTIQHIEGIPDDLKRVFVSSHDISPEYHVRMQAAFQKYTDNAVSKTVNFKNDATKDDIARVYQLAYRTGCKGTTVYRDGSRDEQVLNIGSVSGSQKEEVPQGPRERPDITYGVTEKIKTGCGNLYVTVNYDDQGICEVFTNTSKSGGCPSQSEATARLASLVLKSGIGIDDLCEQIKGIRCPSTIRQPGMKCTSCPDAIAKVIQKEYKKFQNKEQMVMVPNTEESPEQTEKVDVCPECGAPLEHESGCVICRNCSYSKCG